MIIEKQESLGWGKSVVKTLSVELQKEFPGMAGFSADNFSGHYMAVCMTLKI